MPWLRYNIDIDTQEHWDEGERMLRNFLRYAPEAIVVPRHERTPRELNLVAWTELTHHRYRCLTYEQDKALTALHRKRKMDCICYKLEDQMLSSSSG